MTDDTKHCTKCGHTLPADAFSQFRDTRYRTQVRLRAWCRPCTAQDKRARDAALKTSKGRINYTIDLTVWREWQQLVRRRRERHGAALERLIRAELERETVRETLQALRRVSS